MLSKTEREYLSGTYSPSYAHKRFLDHKIKRKIKEFYQLELPLIQNATVGNFATNVSEFAYNQCTEALGEKSQLKLSLTPRRGEDSLHSLDSANACGALGRRFKSDRARLSFIILTFTCKSIICNMS